MSDKKTKKNSAVSYGKLSIKAGSEQIFFVFATIFTSGVHFLFSIYVKKYIMPLEYGIYSSCLLVQTYLAYMQMGTLNSFNRDYPQLIGADDKKKAERYRNVVFTYLCFSGIIAAIAAAVILVLYRRQFDLDYRYVMGMFLCVITTIVTLIENFGNYRARIDRGFSFVGAAMMTELLAVVAGVILIPRMGYFSIYIYNILTWVIGIVIFFRSSFSDIKICIDFSMLKEIILAGAPLLVSGLVWTVLNSIDKFLILGYMEAEQLGVYGIAQNTFSYMVLIPSALSQMFYANMGRKYGEKKSIKLLSETASGYSRILVIVTGLMSLAAYFGIPILVNKVMPAYRGGIYPAQILIVGLAIYASTLINNNILTILKKNVILLRNSVVMCVFNLIFSNLMVLINGANIESVAYGTSISYALNALLIMKCVGSVTETDMWILFINSALPVLVSIVPGIFLYYIFKGSLTGFALALVMASLIHYILYKKDIDRILFRRNL